MQSSVDSIGRAVICDDDALIRSVIRKVLAESSVDIVGEADSPDQAVASLRETGANILVLDLALRGGSGEHLLQWVREQDADIHVVVYSAYAADPKQLLAAGACAVIEKPDFSRLQGAIEQIATAIGVRVERRRCDDHDLIGRLPPATSISISGFEPWDSFLAAADATRAGDAIMWADVMPGPLTVNGWDAVFLTDHRIAVGRVMATGRRIHDRVSVGPNGRPVLLLVGGRPEAPTIVFRRICERWSREVDRGTPVGAFGLIHDGDDPLDRLFAIEASVTMDRTTPLRMA
ncbi:response regulator [Actinospongicola halichondriae]|uniref:response regulator n=1 Tax=Actinospongicola halichondriae TaxID=3236844 RepID=UPI003D3BB87D